VDTGRTVAVISPFNGFQDGGRPSSWILESSEISKVRDYCVILPYFTVIDESIAEI